MNPHRMHPFRTLNSFFLAIKGLEQILDNTVAHSGQHCVSISPLFNVWLLIYLTNGPGK